MCATEPILISNRVITLSTQVKTISFKNYLRQESTMKLQSMNLLMRVTAAAAVLSLAACASEEKTPATAAVAVSHNAVENAVSAGAPELAPQEINAARDKMMRANQALAAKDYKTARELAVQAQADAQLAQSKANSAKATAAADALNQDLRALRQEVDRANTDQK
jgi:hypothetical protein